MPLVNRLAVCVAATLSISTFSKAGPLDYEKTPLTAAAEPVAKGPYEPTWESLSKQRVPDWFRDAKFGIWAHWGPQCQPERGDWYARRMYIEGHRQNVSHVERFGHPSEYGFKEVIRDWKAERFDPDALVALYKKCGAKYFFAMANHHDNFDLWASKHQPWNSVALGPKRNLVADWERAARANDLPFGLSVHAAHAWSWYEPSQGADAAGPKAGVPYDGKLTKAHGAGKWWDGLDPQQLYAQDHPPRDDQKKNPNWTWSTEGGQRVPDAAYCQNFFDRTIDLINQHRPDLIYFDDTVLPLYPISDVGLKIAAHFYNENAARHGGTNDGVLFGKVLKDEHKRAVTWDVERSAAQEIQALPWQTDTCIGGWHYDRPLFERHGYKTAKTVIHMLSDIVSKNGNLLLNVPVRGDGTIDADEVRIVTEIGAWLDTNGEAIYATRPWKRFGEGPALATSNPIREQGFNENKGAPMTAADVRFTTKGDALYVIAMGTPTAPLKLAALGTDARLLEGDVKAITALGSDAKVEWTREADALTIQPTAGAADAPATVYKLTLAR